MEYTSAKLSHRDPIKKLAYQTNSDIWKSYSGKDKTFKQQIDKLRKRVLNTATDVFYSRKNQNRLATQPCAPLTKSISLK